MGQSGWREYRGIGGKVGRRAQWRRGHNGRRKTGGSIVEGCRVAEGGVSGE